MNTTHTPLGLDGQTGRVGLGVGAELAHCSQEGGSADVDSPAGMTRFLLTYAPHFRPPSAVLPENQVCLR